jgi:hypothetical protein
MLAVSELGVMHEALPGNGEAFLRAGNPALPPSVTWLCGRGRALRFFSTAINISLMKQQLLG